MVGSCIICPSTNYILSILVLTRSSGRTCTAIVALLAFSLKCETDYYLQLGDVRLQFSFNLERRADRLPAQLDFVPA